MEKSFKAECPKCNQEPKILKKCQCCKQWCCNLCSIDIICKDCYNIIHMQREVNRYYNDKYRDGMKV